MSEKNETPAPRPARVFDIGDKLTAVLLLWTILAFAVYVIEAL
jgi:hypothetical protein